MFRNQIVLIVMSGMLVCCERKNVNSNSSDSVVYSDKKEFARHANDQTSRLEDDNVSSSENGATLSALTSLSKQPLRDLFESGFSSIAETVTQNPVASVEWLKKCDLAKISPSEVQIRIQVFGLLSQVDGIETEVVKQLDLRKSGSEVDFFFSKLAERKPGLAISLIETAGLPIALADGARGAIARSVAAENPSLAIKLLDQCDPAISSDNLASVFTTWINDDEDAAKEAISKLDNRRLTALIGNPKFSSQAISTSPELILDCLSKIAPTAGNSTVFNSVLTELGKKSPTRTFDFLSGMEDSPLKESLQGSILQTISIQDPTTAKQLLEKAGSAELYESFSRGWAQNDSEAAYRWATGLNGQERENAVYGVLAQWSMDSPEKVLDQIRGSNERILSESGEVSIVHESISTLARRNPIVASSRVLELSPKLQQPGCAALISAWASTDAVAASEWLARLPYGKLRNAGAIELIKQVETTDPEMAQQWKHSIQDK